MYRTRLSKRGPQFLVCWSSAEAGQEAARSILCKARPSWKPSRTGLSETCIELKVALTLAMFLNPSQFRDDYLIGIQNLEFFKWYLYFLYTHTRTLMQACVHTHTLIYIVFTFCLLISDNGTHNFKYDY